MRAREDGRCAATLGRWRRVRVLLAKAWLTESLRKLCFSGATGDVTDGQMEGYSLTFWLVLSTMLREGRGS